MCIILLVVAIVHTSRLALFVKLERCSFLLSHSLSLEQKELCRQRMKLLQYLDRLATYEVHDSIYIYMYVHAHVHVCTVHTVHLFRGGSIPRKIYCKVNNYMASFK